MNQNSDLSVCIVSPRPHELAETFIKLHIDLLPFHVRVLSGVPAHSDSIDGFILKPNIFERISDRFSRNETQRYNTLIARYLKRNRVDCVLAEYGMTACDIMRACESTGIPLVAHFHGHDATAVDLLNQYKVRYDTLFQIAAGVVSVSKEMSLKLESLGCPRDKISWIPCGVDFSNFPTHQNAADSCEFLAVGRFVETKAPHLTVLAFSRVIQEIPHARLTMIGNGPLLGPCIHLAKHLKIQDYIDFLGAQDHSVVINKMRQARAFVQHSVQCLDGTTEGTPVAISEAQAAGLPVVATNHAGIPDVVEHQKTGFLVQEGCVEEMAKAMIQLARNPELARQMGDSGRSRAANIISADQTIGKLAELIRFVTRHCTQRSQ